jgi:anti-anti-sigma factor
LESGFQVRLSSANGTAMVSVAGELDVDTVPELERALEALSGHVVVDCSSLRFMDATAVGAIVRASRRLESLRLVNVDSFIRRMLKVVEVDTMFLADDVDSPAGSEAPDPNGPDDVVTPPPSAKATE